MKLERPVVFSHAIYVVCRLLLITNFFMQREHRQLNEAVNWFPYYYMINFMYICGAGLKYFPNWI